MLLRFHYVLSFLFVVLWLAWSQAQAQDVPNTEVLNEEVVNTEEAGEEQAASGMAVSGRVLERGTRKPLANVEIVVLPDEITGQTNDQGRFSLSNLPLGKSTWILLRMGYDKLEVEQELQQKDSQDAQDTKELTFYLTVAQDAVFETLVVGQKDKRDQARRTVEQDQFLFAPGARGDPVVALLNEPAIDLGIDTNELVIQGADPEDSRYTINGHEIPLVFHFLGFSSVLIPDVVSSVDYYTAGFGPEYGRAIGGTVNLVTQSPKTDRLHTMAYVDLLNAGAVIQGPIDSRQSFWLGGRLSYLGPVLDLVTSADNDVTFRSAPNFWDLQGYYQWNIDGQHQFSLLGIGARDTIELFVRDATDPSLKGDFGISTQFYRLLPRWTYTISDQEQLDISLAAGQDFQTFEVGGRFFDFKAKRLSLRAEHGREWNDHYETFIGVDALASFSQLEIAAPLSFFTDRRTNRETPLGITDTLRASLSKNDINVATYVRQRIRWSAESPLTISPNARVDYFSLSNNVHVSPRLELAYQFNPVWRLRLSSGLYYQPPRLEQVAPGIGNPNLGDEQALHYSLGADIDLRGNRRRGFFGSTDVFYKDLDDLVVASTEIVNREGILGPERFNNSGEGYVVGSQWSLRYHSGLWQTAVAYTLSRSVRTDPVNGSSFSLYDKTHVFNIINVLRLGQWSLSSRFRWTTGNPYTPIVGAAYDADADVYRPFQGSQLSKRLPQFWQWDLRLDRKFFYRTWILSFYLDVQNVTNRANVNEIDYNFDYSEEIRESGLPILPALGVKGEF